MFLSPVRAVSIICLARSARVEGAQASSASALPDDLNLSQALLNAVVRIWVVSGSKAASRSRETIGIAHPSLLTAIYYVLGAKQHTRVKNRPQRRAPPPRRDRQRRPRHADCEGPVEPPARVWGRLQRWGDVAHGPRCSRSQDDCLQRPRLSARRSAPCSRPPYGCLRMTRTRWSPYWRARPVAMRGLSQRPKTFRCLAAVEATPHSGGGPLRADAYHSHPRSARAIDQRVRTDFVVDVCDVDLRCRLPLQGLGYIAGPDAPCGTVSEFHQMAPIVFFDLHCRSPLWSIRALARPKGAEMPTIPGATTRAPIGPKDGCADEFFRERRDRSAPPLGTKRIPQPRGRCRWQPSPGH